MVASTLRKCSRSGLVCAAFGADVYVTLTIHVLAADLTPEIVIAPWYSVAPKPARDASMRACAQRSWARLRRKENLPGRSLDNP